MLSRHAVWVMLCAIIATVLTTSPPAAADHTSTVACAAATAAAAGTGTSIAVRNEPSLGWKNQ